jgi:hypothetical protein
MAIMVEFVGLDDRVGGALDAALDAHRVQQVAREGGLARAQRTFQLDEGVGQPGPERQTACRKGARGLVGPGGLRCS